MLMVTRRAGEAVWIGPDICVRIVEIVGGQVRLGFEAPRRYEIFREEILSSGRASIGAPCEPNARGRRQREVNGAIERAGVDNSPQHAEDGGDCDR